jgi:hypothetical protein
MIKVFDGYVLIELDNAITIKTKTTDSFTEGVLKSVPSFVGAFWREYLNKTVYFSKYEDSTVIEDGGKRYIIIPEKELRGYKCQNGS